MYIENSRTTTKRVKDKSKTNIMGKENTWNCMSIKTTKIRKKTGRHVSKEQGH